MSYLFGDSTPSTLESNFIDFLRDAVDFCVQALTADERIAEGKARTRALETSTAADVAKLEKIAALVPRALDGAPVGDADSAAARCVAAIVQAAEDLVRAAKSEVGAAHDAEIHKRDAAAVSAREGCVKALEALLIKHDLPDMKSDLQIALVGGTRYACRMDVTTTFGLEAALELEVPPNHLLERVVRVDRVMERLEVQVPEMGGWIHKEIRLKAQHLEKHHVVELLLKTGADRLRLRAGADGKGPGFDVLYGDEGSAPRLVRVDDGEKGGEKGGESFDVEEADRPKLIALRDRLAAAATELGRHRKAVLEAKLDGESLRAHAEPARIVERLIGTLAPVVQEIAARSQSVGELVLRRLLGGDRREEIFLSKQELKVKLEPLDAKHRLLFEPLWLARLPESHPPAPLPQKMSMTAPAPAPTTPSNDSLARTPLVPTPIDLLRTPLVPTPGPTIPSFEPPNPDAFKPVPAEPTRPESPLARSIASALGSSPFTPVNPATATLAPPPPPPARAEPPQQASGFIELKDVDVAIEDSSGPTKGN
jgi:hypothetical protein